MTDLVRVRGLSKSFGEVEVLHDIDLTVGPHERVSIIGPSGSGKSTLLRCINRLEQHNAGEVWVGDQLMGYSVANGVAQELPERKVAAQRQSIGMVFQQFHLFRHMTVLENVAEGPSRILKEGRAEAEKRAMRLLDRVGLADRADAYPSALSGGQQQRIAIARALAMRPRLLLFDEPTSALDPERVGEVLEVIRGLSEEHEAALIIVTHELDFAADVSDRIVFMVDGRIDSIVEPRDLLKAPKGSRLSAFVGQMRANRG